MCEIRGQCVSNHIHVYWDWLHYIVVLVSYRNWVSAVFVIQLLFFFITTSQIIILLFALGESIIDTSILIGYRINTRLCVSVDAVNKCLNICMCLLKWILYKWFYSLHAWAWMMLYTVKWLYYQCSDSLIFSISCVMVYLVHVIDEIRIYLRNSNEVYS